MIDLGNHFSDFDSDKLETYNLPTVPYPPDENRLLLDESRTPSRSLNVFRGLAPGRAQARCRRRHGAQRHDREAGLRWPATSAGPCSSSASR